MISPRKPLATMAAVTVALAVALPAANAGAARHPRVHLDAPSPAQAQTCQIMSSQGAFVAGFANPVYANAQAQVAKMNGCAGS